MIKHILLGVLTLVMVGCASQATEQAIITIPEADYPFAEIVAAATDAEMSIISTDSSAGIITANAPYNPLLTWHSPIVNIYVRNEGDMTKIEAFSSVKGQMVTYGTNSAAIQSLCNSLQSKRPDTVCSMVESR